jgi:hypothetical protein
MNRDSRNRSLDVLKALKTRTNGAVSTFHEAGSVLLGGGPREWRDVDERTGQALTHVASIFSCQTLAST